MSGQEAFVLSLTEIRRGDVGKVGGKNASLGEMIGGRLGYILIRLKSRACNHRELILPPIPV